MPTPTLFFPALSLVLFNIALAVQVILFTRTPTFRDDIPGIAGVHVVIAGLFCLVWPGFLRLMNKRRSSSFREFLAEFKLPVLILLVPILLRSYGLYSHNDAVVKYLVFPLLGMATPAVYSTFFTLTPQRFQGRTLGAMLVLAVAAWGAAVVYLNQGSTPESAMMRERNVYHLLSLVMAANFFLVLHSLYNGRGSLLPGLRVLKSETAKKRGRSVLCLSLALATFFLLNGFQSAKLFPFFRNDSPEPSITLSAMFTVICFTVGWLVDRNRSFYYKYIILFSSLCLMIAPSALALDRGSFALRAVITLGMAAQFAIMITSQVILGGLMTDNRWFCLGYCYPYASRAIAVIGAWAVGFDLVSGAGIIILLSTLSAFLFYYLANRVDPVLQSDTEAGEDKERTPPDHGEENKNGGKTVPDRLFNEYGLSPREKEVADLLIKGCSTRDISRGLAISEHTVKVHVRNILAKFSVPNRKAFLAKFIDS